MSKLRVEKLKQGTSSNNDVLVYRADQSSWVGQSNATLNQITSNTANVITSISVASANAIINSSAVSTKSVIFDQSAGITATAGQATWNSTDGTLDIGLLNGVTLQTGQEQHFYGKATEAINNGQAVMFAGAQGEHVLFALANTSAPGFIPEWIIGVATQNFSTNDFGYVTTYGKVRNIDTSAYANGDILFVSTTTAGGFTSTEPTSPNRKIRIAAVVRAHATQGALLVRPTWSDSLSELDDVYVNGVANNDVLTYDAVNSRWKNNHTPTFGNTTVSGDITISGNLTVSGTTTYVNSTTLNIGDNIVTLNADLGASAPSENAGIEVNRGTSAHVAILWDETIDRWVATNDGTTYANIAIGAAGATLTANGTDTATYYLPMANATTGSWTNAVIDSSLSFVPSTNTLTAGIISIASGLYPTSNTVGTALGSTTQRWVLIANTGTFSGAVSGITTLAAGNTTITGFANVTSTIQGGAGLTIAGAASGITTLAAGNTTITGFANVTSTLQVTGAVTFSNTLSVAGNVTGTAANVTIVAGSYTSTFANTGATSLPGSLAITGALSGVTTLAAGNTTITGFVNVTTSVAAANINTSGTVSADIITVSNVSQTQTNLQVDPAGSAFLNAIIYG